MSQSSDSGSRLNITTKEMLFNLNKSVQVGKVTIAKDTRLMINDTIFMMIDTNGQRQSFLSPISGTVTKLYIHESDILSYGSIILEYEECRHTIRFKNLCGDCGIDLNQLGHVLEPLNANKTAISMEPSFPEVTITREEGLKYDYEEYQHLLRKRKLHLLVDLDQTLVHTIHSSNNYPPLFDIVSYQLTPVSPISHTKLRPGIKAFLTNLQPFYQFHLVTFGDRLYANTIAKIIDPNKTFFSHRILSRDECLSQTDKTANLNSLFPCGDSLVCIIDDREDVWNCAPNLVQVKPYIWFNDVGDTNNNNIQDNDQYLYQLEIILKRIHTGFYQAYDQWIYDKHRHMPDLKQIIPDIRRQILSSVSLCFSHLMPRNYPFEKHRATIIAKAMGAQVTSDLQFDSDGKLQTTHIIAGKRTLKVHQARENKIKVVTPDWLIDCYEYWEKIPEENYIFRSGYQVRKSRLFTEETPRVTKRRHISIVEQSLSDLTINPNKRSGIETKINELSIDDDDNIHPRPKKQQRTTLIAETIQENHEDSDSDDSSCFHQLDRLVLDEKDNPNSEEEHLSDDETPRGWKEDRNKNNDIHNYY